MRKPVGFGLVNLDSEKVKENVDSALRAGMDPIEIVTSLADGHERGG